MQIDFHLGVTYVMARLAGFDRGQANTIAGSSQHVDEAVLGGTIYFTNNAVYEFIASAHKMLDYRNYEELANHHVWIPFHFLPANSGREFVDRIICRPDSLVANELVASCKKYSQKPFALHLLGVAIHAYVDTWAHQGFAGIDHSINQVGEIYDWQGVRDTKRMNYRDSFFRREWWRWLWDRIRSFFANNVNPVGHGPLLSYPDMPFLKFKYQNSRGEIVERNNPEDFYRAALCMYEKFCDYRKALGLHVLTMQENDLRNIKKNLATFTQELGAERLEAWKQSIANADFSFGKDVWDYRADGLGSWLHDTFKIENPKDFKYEAVEFPKDFMYCDWKLFHDALLFHRFLVIHDILPKHELCIS